MALGGGACSHDIGDGCQTSVDCDPSGTRSCDLSQPGGYCTINGCDETTCPSGATCVRYFPEALLELDGRYVVPALEALGAGRIRQLTLIANDRALRAGRFSRLRLWRRPRFGVEGLT